MRRGRQEVPPQEKNTSKNNNNADHQKNGPKQPPQPKGNNKNNVSVVSNSSTSSAVSSNNKNQKSQQQHQVRPKSKSPPPPPPVTATAKKQQRMMNTATHVNRNNNNNNNQNNSHSSVQNPVPNFINPNNNFLDNHPAPTSTTTLTQTALLIRDAHNQTWGVQIFDLTNGHRNQLHSRNSNWVRYKIEAVDAHSPAFYCGLRPGDIIIGVIESSSQRAIFIQDFNDFGKYLSENNSIRLRIERTVPIGEANSAEHRIRLPPPPEFMNPENGSSSNNNNHIKNQNLAAPWAIENHQHQHPPAKEEPRRSSAGVLTPLLEQHQFHQQIQNIPRIESSTSNNNTKIANVVSSSEVKELGWFLKLVSSAIAAPSLNSLEALLTGGGDTKKVSGTRKHDNVNALPTRSTSDVEADRKFLEELMKTAKV